MWVVDSDGSAFDNIYVYNLANKSHSNTYTNVRQPSRERKKFEGIWSDGTNVWLAGGSGRMRKNLYGYTLSNISVSNIKPPLDFKPANYLFNYGNELPTSIWSDGATMWVADYEDDKIYAYSYALSNIAHTLATNARSTTEDFNTLSDAGNEDPRGLWSDGTTMWVADGADGKIYAYDMVTKARVPAQDFNTLSGAGNGNPHGIWSDGSTMWVVDHTDNKIYAYKK